MMNSAGGDASPAPASPATKKPERPPSTFSVTCNLLSQYLKERKTAGFGDLGLGIGGSDRVRTTPTTMSLMPGVNISGNEDGEGGNEGGKGNALRNVDLELFPQRTGFASSEEAAGKTAGEVQEKSQLTIFYGGKVLVFDDFSEDKAREIVNFASRACEALLKQSVVSPVSHVDHPSGASQHNAASFPSTSGCCPPVAEQPSSLAQASGSEMPIARRASLHRFLEKRKDRVIAKAPYQLNAAPPPPAEATGAAKPEESLRWHGFKP
ncbi:protein TIFY 10b-like [Dioscorea cayenensis subsp. rotundata]|uniref:Protein TIFY n=1 Tax=Dioscorea cayennensis subsp. rotundata TaxID=55577 RepID=A0AB40BAF8_DIOCR|nr:protein TIFY 10b-like [Dioscorea cayenensis subsp. rotundata]